MKRLLPVSLTLRVPDGSRDAAPASYTLRPLAQIGGTAGDVPIPKDRIWHLGPLNDNGQFLCSAEAKRGWMSAFLGETRSDTLLQYAEGKFTLLVVGGMYGPIGPWPKDIIVGWPFNMSMNGRGNCVFNTWALSSGMGGTFYRDAESGKMTAVVLPGMPATGDLIFGDEPDELVVGLVGTPAINNRDEIALSGGVKGTGSPSGRGLFFRAPDGALQPIFIPGQALPDDKKGQFTDPFPSITDAGVVAFLVQRQGDTLGYSAYQWEKGDLAPLVIVGMDAPGGGKITAVSSVWLNNQNRSALVSASIAGQPGHGLYRVAGGTLMPVAVPGREMPGGGKLKSLADPGGRPAVTFDISVATEAGQHAFAATLDDNTTGLYRMEADGALSLVLKSGMATPLGKITRFAKDMQPAMNSKGHVIVSASFDKGPDTLVLLTPAAR
jgi:hypothetical protein